MFKLLIKRASQILFVLLAVPLIYVVIIGQFDETLDPEFTALYATQPSIPDHENGFVAFNGLDAPEGEDVIAFGRKMIDHGRKTYLSNDDQQKAQNGGITFKGDSSSLKCWITQDGKEKSQKEGKPCADAATVRAMVRDNQLLLRRYAMLAHYPHFVQSEFGDPHNGQLIIQLQTLLSASMALNAAEGNAEHALATWLHYAQMLNHLYTGQSSYIMQAILMVNRGINLKTLPLILAAMTPQQIAAHQAALNAVFDVPAFGPNSWDISATMRAESMILVFAEENFAKPHQRKDTRGFWERVFKLYQPNATRNLFTKVSRDTLAFSKLPASSLSEAQKDLDTDYYTRSRWGIHSLYNGIGKMIMSGILDGSDLVVAAHEQVAVARLLKLYTAAKIAGIQPKDMPGFVAATTPDMRDPVTEKPFDWNAQKNSIGYTRPKYNHEFGFVY